MLRAVEIGGVIALIACLSFGQAVEPADVKPLDRAIADGLRDLHNRGADIHNAGDPIGAWRMYQGGLIGLKPLLAHRADAQRAIDDGIKLAESRPINERALTLSKTIVDVRKRTLGELTELHAPKTLTPNSPPAAPNIGSPAKSPSSFPNLGNPQPAPGLTATLWDRLGGEKKVEKIVDEWITQSMNDSKVNFSRGGLIKIEGETLSTLKRRFVGFVSSVSDGTVPYTGRPMKESHAGMSVTSEEFTVMLNHLRTALKKEAILDVDADTLIKKIEAAKADIVTK